MDQGNADYAEPDSERRSLPSLRSLAIGGFVVAVIAMVGTVREMTRIAAQSPRLQLTASLTPDERALLARMLAKGEGERRLTSRLPPTARPVRMRNMDQNREDYRDAPIRRRQEWVVKARRQACRVILTLTLVLAVGFFGCHWHRQRQAAKYYDDTYSWIMPGQWEPEVRLAMGGRGRTEALGGWPRTVADVPGYERLTLAKPDAELRWQVWSVPGRHRWIAVAFVNDGMGGSAGVLTVVTKRSGAD
jgi:hypothetical protein